MTKYKKLLVLLLILAGFVSVILYISRRNSQVPQSTQVSQKSNTILTVGDESFDASSFAGKSALETTKGFAKVEETGTGEGAFVTAINGKSADPKKREFWELVINGQSAQVGAGTYIVQGGDSILWRLSTY